MDSERSEFNWYRKHEPSVHFVLSCFSARMDSFICGYGKFVMKSTNAAFLEGVRINHCYLETQKGPSEVVSGEVLTNEQKLVEICRWDLTDL